MKDEKIVPIGTDWSSFRREAAKDILCALIGNKETISAKGERVGQIEVSNAIILADELIKQLKDEPKKGL